MEGVGAPLPASLLQAELSSATIATYALYPGGDLPYPEEEADRKR